jgi:UDP-N-acetylmuramoylalanine--D-glutamate ligase
MPDNIPMEQTRLPDLKGSRVLVIGIGAYGGGASTALWLAGRGALVTIVDTRSQDLLADSITQLEKNSSIQIHLGPFSLKDAVEKDLVIPYPGMPEDDPFLVKAIDNGALLTTETNLFLAHVKNYLIGITGTRGKTTVTNWVCHFLRRQFSSIHPVGNTPGYPLLSEMEVVATQTEPMVLELSSWQLDHADRVSHSPNIAIITNIYRDHQNHYKSMDAYVRSKMNIFLHQGDGDTLILNWDSPWRDRILAGEPKGEIRWFSTNPLPAHLNGIWLRDRTLMWRENGTETSLSALPDTFFERGAHNIENLLATIAAVHIFDSKFTFSPALIGTLPTVTMRQEIVRDSGGVRAVNDATATTPDALAAAIQRFSSQAHSVFIAGGTDKDLDYTGVAKLIANTLQPGQLILHPGSGTDKLVAALNSVGYPTGECAMPGTLRACVITGLERVRETGGTLILSPGGSSFEHFRNEFDRGRTFNKLIDELL